MRTITSSDEGATTRRIADIKGATRPAAGARGVISSRFRAPRAAPGCERGIPPTSLREEHDAKPNNQDARCAGAVTIAKKCGPRCRHQAREGRSRARRAVRARTERTRPSIDTQLRGH